jgi:aryl-alcohol dehydrogenase-like predicted oxidoreductase
MTLIELAYAFVAGTPDIQGILLGPASVLHLEDAVSACEKKLPDTLRAELDALHVAWSGTDTTYAR